jgi:GxxExxY protein
VRHTAYDIHVYHGHGHLERVYESALAHRLRKAGLDVRQQHPIRVYDEDGTLIGDYSADLLVERRLIVELKAARTMAPEHEAQILGYLKSSRLEHGLLINFGSFRFEIRKFVWSREGHRRPGKPRSVREPCRSEVEAARTFLRGSLCSLRSLRLNQLPTLGFERRPRAG